MHNSDNTNTTYLLTQSLYNRVSQTSACLEVSVVAFWPWLLKSTACNDFYCAEIIYSICLHNSSSGQQLVMTRMNEVSFQCFYKVQIWFSGRLFNYVIASLHAKNAAKAPRPRILLGSCGLDNTLLYALIRRHLSILSLKKEEKKGIH